MITGTDAGPLPDSARMTATTVIVFPGDTRVVEFVADNPGDWALHCHRRHHVMNPMGHEIPNVIGVDQGGVEERIRTLLPGYRAMGESGMHEMAEMGQAEGRGEERNPMPRDHSEHAPARARAHAGRAMQGPENTLPMMGGDGPFGPIAMGGMFTVLKVREGITTYEDPGWYEHPEGTIARSVRKSDSSGLRRRREPGGRGTHGRDSDH